MSDSIAAEFESQGWWVHTWNNAGQEVTVLQAEPFRMEWVATQLVTYVFLIRRKPVDYQSIANDYPALRRFASEHKRTILPFSIQCGYALLPIYVADSYSDALVEDVATIYRKRWCVMHVPTLVESNGGRVHTLTAESLWGCIYRKYIASTIHQVSGSLVS